MNDTSPRRELLAVLDSVEVQPQDRLGAPEARAQAADAILTILAAPHDPAIPAHMMKSARLRRLMNYLVFQGVPKEQRRQVLALVADYARPDHVVTMLCKGRDRTDIGLAERLADWYGPDITRSPGLGWFGWTGTHWRAGDAKDVLQPRAKRVARHVESEATALADTYAAWEPAEGDTPEQTDKTREIQAVDLKAAKGFAKAAQTVGKINAMMDLVISESGITIDDVAWDSNSALLGTPNATLELGATVVARDVRRLDRITMTTAVEYQRGAEGECWMRFLAQALPDAEVRRYFRKLVGAALYGANPERLLVFLIGPTSTGKSTALAILAKVLGHYAGAFELSMLRGKEQEAPRPDLIEALPKRFLHTTEAGSRWELHGEEIKRITGGVDELKARKMRSDVYLTREPAFMAFIASNVAPTIINTDTALYRRLTVVPFDNAVSADQEDKQLVARIVATEGPAVLAWAVRGWELYQEEGLRDVPDACVRATMKLRDSLSILDTWLAEETEQDSAHTCTSADLWDAFVTWCKDAGVADKDRGNRVAFGKALAGKGYTTGKVGPKDKRVNGWTGLRLAPRPAARL